MIRRLNYTGRRKIPRNRVRVRLADGEDAFHAFTIDFDLDGLGFPGDARVFVEAYNAVSWMRFDFGTVGNRDEPADLRLTDVTRHPLPKFRVKVVDHGEYSGRLLGVADQLLPLRPQEDEQRQQPLLPVDFVDLGDEIWRLDLSDWPVLELNLRVAQIGELARAGEDFLALVYPEVVRRILHEIVIEQGVIDPGLDDTEWTCLWLRYICTLPDMEPPPEAEGDQPTWVDQAVQSFCHARNARARYAAAIVAQEAAR